MFNKRITDRLASYWDKLLKGEKLPDFHSFNNEAVTDIWQNCFEISVQHKGPETKFIYGYVGKEIVKAFGQDLRGFTFTESVKAVPGDKVMLRIAKAVESVKPVTEEGVFVNKKSEVVKYRMCIVPFSDGNKEEVAKVIVGMTWHEKA